MLQKFLKVKKSLIKINVNGVFCGSDRKILPTDSLEIIFKGLGGSPMTEDDVDTNANNGKRRKLSKSISCFLSKYSLCTKEVDTTSAIFSFKAGG